MNIGEIYRLRSIDLSSLANFRGDRIHPVSKLQKRPHLNEDYHLIKVNLRTGSEGLDLGRDLDTYA